MSLEKMEEHFEKIELSNGIKGIVYPINAPVVHVGIAIKAGSKFDVIPGTAHLLEHMIFKGTENRRAFQINNFLDSVGGELNAYTHKDEMVVYASVRKEFFERALELLADLVQNAVFPEKELQREKPVVIDEIHSYLETPAEQIFDDFEELLFAETPLGHPVLGSLSSVQSITTDDLRQFYKQYFVAQNMVFSVVGAFNKKRDLKLIDQYFSSIKSGNTKKAEKKQSEIVEFNRFEARFSRASYQTHVIFGAPSYDYYSPKRRILLLLNNIIGGPSLNSLLNKILREQKGWTYNAESSVSSYEEAGSFAIYFSCEEENLKKARNSVKKTLRDLCEGRLSDRQFTNYKRQFIGHLALSNDNHAGMMLTLCKSMLIFGKVDTIAQIEQEIMEISKQQLIDVANEVIHPDNLSSIIYYTKNK
ncbi:MAG: insulinase family protein [Bacteroidetes bacterium]|nr:MAG: insulinase family protein [Bacteroidota bacterium]